MENAPLTDPGPIIPGREKAALANFQEGTFILVNLVSIFMNLSILEGVKKK